MSKRKLILCYEAYVEVTLPTELADKLESGEIPWSDDWATICFTDPDGGHEVQEVEGKTQDVDYKRATRHYWEDNTEDRALLKWKEFLKQSQTGPREAASETGSYEMKDYVDFGADETAPRIKISEQSSEPTKVKTH